LPENNIYPNVQKYSAHSQSYEDEGELQNTVSWFNGLIFSSIEKNTELKESRDEWSRRIEFLDKLMLELKNKPIDIEKSERVNILCRYLMSARDLIEENTYLIKNKMDMTIESLNSINKEISGNFLMSCFNYNGLGNISSGQSIIRKNSLLERNSKMSRDSFKNSHMMNNNMNFYMNPEDMGWPLNKKRHGSSMEKFDISNKNTIVNELHIHDDLNTMDDKGLIKMKSDNYANNNDFAIFNGYEGSNQALTENNLFNLQKMSHETNDKSL